jgi:hypothetical protein
LFGNAKVVAIQNYEQFIQACAKLE